MALNLYIDHEPLNKQVVPNLCRVIELKEKIIEKRFDFSPKKIKDKLSNLLRKKDNSIEKKTLIPKVFENNLFEFLLRESFKFIEEEV